MVWVAFGIYPTIHQAGFDIQQLSFFVSFLYLKRKGTIAYADMQSVGQKKTKTLRKHCNATITRVFNTSGANYKINLNRESEISY